MNAGDAQRDSRTSVWIAIAAAAVLIALRKPWAFHTPQLWAEDGNIFLVDSERFGAHAILRPYLGYLSLIPRLIAFAARATADVAWWPAIYNGAAFAVMLGVLARMGSPRLDVPRKAWLVLAFALTVQSGEVLVNLANVQWISAFWLVQQLLMEPPRTPGEMALDVALVALAGLTGPFAVVMAPFFLWRTARSPSRGAWVVCAVVLACAAIQAASLVRHGPAVAGSDPFIHFDFFRFLALVGNRLVAWPFLGSWVTTSLPGGALAALGVVGIGAIAVLVARAPAQQRHMQAQLLVLALVFLALAAWRARPDTWYADDIVNGDRYFFIPRLVLAWIVIWLLDAPRRSVAIAARALCVVAVLLELPGHVLPAPPDYRWAENCGPIRRGEPALIPTLPPGWMMPYWGRPER